MSNSKHTPGPWTVDGRGIFARRGEDAEAYVADTYSGEDSALLVKNSIGAAEADRNARLIAAAPDLLAALVECEAALRSPESPSHRGLAEEQAREAIRKAVGDVV